MKALYTMQYVGQEGTGAGALYVGGGIVLGVDIANCRYNGTYVEERGRLIGTASLSAPTDREAGPLVTGAVLGPGESIPLKVDWPEGDLDDGKPRTLSVAGREIAVVFSKIGDIP